MGVATADAHADELWVECFAECDVNVVEGDEFSVRVTASGRVVDAGGQPVGDAVVLLRETIASSLQLWSPDRKRETSPTRRSDVLARTRTDANGKFEFEGVKAPPFSNAFGTGWRGEILAGHPELGFAQVWLSESKP